MRNAELVGQAEAGNAIDDAEIDRLGPAAHFGRHVLHRHAENLRRRHGVNVEIVGKGFFQFRNIGDMRQQPQLDLAVIGADQLCALGAIKAWRMRRPSSVRTGMFCRLGSVEASRPVEVEAMA